MENDQKPKKKKKKYIPTGEPVGRPDNYKPQYCQMLIEHMKRGDCFTTFAATIDTTFQTTYSWLGKYPEFLEAKKKGEVLLLKWDMDLMKAGIAGQLKVISEEIETVGIDGTKKVLKKYRAATYGQHMHKHRMGNVHRWVDKIQLENTDSESALLPASKVKAVLKNPKAVALLRELEETLESDQ